MDTPGCELSVTRGGSVQCSALGSITVDLNPGPDPDSMDVDSQYGGSTSNKSIVYPNKRPRTGNPTGNTGTKQATIFKLPPELFTEIFKYLRPGELLSLARSCSALRDNLMSRKDSQSIWWTAMEKVRKLPPCPPGFSEPQYLTVLFSNFCTNCGSTKKPQIDPTLLVRLCKPCSDTCLVQLIDTRQVPDDIRVFLHKSNVFGSGRRRELPPARVLKSDVHKVINALSEVRQSGDDHALVELEKKMKGAVEERKILCKDITRALELYENDLDWERMEIQRKRCLEIERRCIDDLKVEQEDLQFAWDSPPRKKYYKLRDRPELLSDREWGEIRSKVHRLLKANRKDRLAKELDHQRNQSNYQEQPGCPRQSLSLEVDPVADGLYLQHVELIEILG